MTTENVICKPDSENLDSWLSEHGPEDDYPQGYYSENNLGEDVAVGWEDRTSIYRHKTWLRALTGIDRAGRGCYALQGGFLNWGRESRLEVGQAVVALCEPLFFRCGTRGGIRSREEGNTIICWGRVGQGGEIEWAGFEDWAVCRESSLDALESYLEAQA